MVAVIGCKNLAAALLLSFVAAANAETIVPSRFVADQCYRLLIVAAPKARPTMSLRSYSKARTSPAVKGIVLGAPPVKSVPLLIKDFRWEERITEEGVRVASATLYFDTDETTTLEVPMALVSPAALFAADQRPVLYSMWSDSELRRDVAHLALEDHRFLSTCALLERLPQRLGAEIHQQRYRDLEALRREDSRIVGVGWFIDEPPWEATIQGMRRMAADPRSNFLFRWGPMVAEGESMTETEMERLANQQLSATALTNRAIEESLSKQERQLLKQFGQFVGFQRFIRSLSTDHAGELPRPALINVADGVQAKLIALIRASGVALRENQGQTIHAARRWAEWQAGSPLSPPPTIPALHRLF